MVEINSVRAVLFDLDGTLLSKQRQILDSSIQTINKLKAQGIAIGIATGRILRSVIPFFESLHVDLPITLLNGSLILDPITHAVLDRHILSSEVVKKIYQITRDSSLRLHLYTAEDVFLDMEDDELYKKIDPIAYQNSASIEGVDFDSTQFHKAMITGEKTETLGWELLNELLAQEPGSFYPVSSYKDHIEIMHPLANKKNGLEYIQNHAGIQPSEIIAFGDADNDLGIIQSVGWGVAMQNASSTLKDHAKITIGSHNEHSISEYLTTLFNL